MAALSVSVNLPFKPAENDEGNDCYNNIEGCALYRMLPANAKEYVKGSPHLLEYLHMFPVNTYGIPLFFSELKRDLKSMKEPNIIYPANEVTFIHIFPDPNDSRNYYIPIEPSFLHNVTSYVPSVERKLVDLLDSLDEDPSTEAERKEVLKKLITQVVYVKNPDEQLDMPLLGDDGSGGLKKKIMDFLQKDLTAGKPRNVLNLPETTVPELPDGRVILGPAEYKALEYMIVRDKIEMGP
ncbi:MAG TPA: secretion system protein E, partial [Methanomicrobiales archaeon]|nr:secretion system protein E [Methanomicrobiales archaeon]